MKSLLSNYFNRQATIDETTTIATTATTTISTTTSTNKVIQQPDTTSFSSLGTTSLTASTLSSSNDQVNSVHNDLNLNIKFIDDIDTDGVCYSSTDDEASSSGAKHNRRVGFANSDSNHGSSIRRLVANQLKSNETGKQIVFCSVVFFVCVCCVSLFYLNFNSK